MEYSDLSGRSCYLDLPSNSCTLFKMKHVLQLKERINNQILGVKELTIHIIANITKQTLSLKIKYKNFCYLDFLLKGVLTWWLNLQINELYFLSSKKRYTIKSNQAPLNQTSKMTFSFHKLCNHRRIKSIWKQQARQNTFSPKTPLRQKTEFNLHSLKEMKWCWLSTSCTLTWSWAKFFNICSGYSSDLGTWENLFYPINNSMISVTNYTSFAAVGFRWFPADFKKGLSYVQTYMESGWELGKWEVVWIDLWTEWLYTGLY